VGPDLRVQTLSPNLISFQYIVTDLFERNPVKPGRRLEVAEAKGRRRRDTIVTDHLGRPKPG
jgi:hypothetical protein